MTQARMNILGCFMVLCGLAVPASLWGQSVSRPTVEAATQSPAGASTSSSPLKSTKKDDPCNQAPDLTKTFGRAQRAGLTPKQALAQFVVAYQKLDKMVDEHAAVMEAFEKAESEEKQKEIGPKLVKLTDEVHNVYHETQELIEQAWEADPTNPQVISYSLFLLASSLDEDQYEVAINLTRELMSKKIHEKNPMLYEMAGIASFMVNKFDVARLCFNEALRNKELSETGGSYAQQIPYYQEAWKTEQELRQKETAAKDLPIVLLQTSKGDVYIELFENQAPNTVANFISLVEKGYYNDNLFHTVLPGFMAQSGSNDVEGEGNPGYTIPDEFDRPDVRKHFRGSLSMAHTEAPNSAGSQFFITLVPCQHLDGKYTVFGRVIRGMEVISALERVNVSTGSMETDTGLNEADKILRAKVLRKRNHDYVPKTIPVKK
ncbi:MAG: peptidylprolyl isomerase [Planctomycetia bacterium]|nr:peptidylprolyl isomerase [Planctomycetia bacterium]